MDDLRALAWSSIDNDDSRDLDQVEFAERTAGGIRILVGIADIGRRRAPRAPPSTASPPPRPPASMRAYASSRCCPSGLSTGLTSLLEGQDRLAVVTEFTVGADGAVRARARLPRPHMQPRATRLRRRRAVARG